MLCKIHIFLFYCLQSQLVACKPFPSQKIMVNKNVLQELRDVSRI